MSNVEGKNLIFGDATVLFTHRAWNFATLHGDIPGDTDEDRHEAVGRHLGEGGGEGRLSGSGTGSVACAGRGA